MPLNPNTVLKLLFYSFFPFIMLFIFGCSSGRYAERSKIGSALTESEVSDIRVLLEDKTEYYNYTIESPVVLMNEDTPIAVVKTGNRLNFSIDGSELLLNIAGKSFEGKYFRIKPEDSKSLLTFNGKVYRGTLKFIPESGKVKVINSVELEDYVKGVVPAEMPTGRGNEYFEALKAFAICARTYAVNKFKGNGASFDVYLDTRDQVYGGVSAEKKISDRAVEETKNIILGYEGKPAIVYYHASCGGHTEKASNVFPVPDLPYLRGVKDGDPPNCSIAPNFSWEVTFPEKIFIKRLYEAGLIPDRDYSVVKVDAESRFESGRVNELLIVVNSRERYEKQIIIKGNRIRYVLKPPGGGILRSTLFNIFTDENNNVIVKGKGNGHGVGLCQWGALHLSEEGRNYKSILSFYFPGTELMELR